jgi:polyisoprenyl-teichoic acid--peptidoglycan teichoic acid transferase
MKYFLKVFTVAILIFMILAGFNIYQTYKAIDEANNRVPNYNENWLSDFDSAFVSKEMYEAYISESQRINFLFVGLENTRTDTIMLASYDQKNKQIDVVSIPRDTYYYKEGFRSGYRDISNYKINAVYGGDGIEGLERAVEDLLHIPIHHYVTITMSGVANIVDSLGGIEVDVPLDMYYVDKYANPPLKIDIKAGKQILDGQNAIGFLRFRKSSDGKVAYGDIQRIQMQQQFLMSVAKKTLSFKLPTVAKEAFNMVETDASLSSILKYASGTIGISTDDINFHTLPGQAEYIKDVSFYIAEGRDIQHLVYALYGIPFHTADNNQ